MSDQGTQDPARPATVAEGQVCSIRYTTWAGEAAVDQRTAADPPVAFLVGHRNILPGLEKALLGRSVGERVSVTLPPEEAYGLRDEKALQRVARKHLKQAEPLAVGTLVGLDGAQGRRICTVRKVGMTVVDLDLNHPLAGQTLTIEAEVVDLRAASADELAHGHAHGPGGVAHG